MKLHFYGADRCVTGSCHCLEINGKKILVDCGLQQGRDELDNRYLAFAPGNIDILLVTHAHIDHTGRIPLLVKNGFHGRILTTRLTADLMKIMLLDSAHIQESDAEYENRKGERAGREHVDPLYTEQDALDVFKYVTTCEYKEKVDLCEGVSAVFTDAGHLLGSASITLELEENGVHVLSNTYVMLERGGDRIALLGAEDSNGYADQKTIAELSEEVRQEQGDVYKILLSHRNTRIEEYVDAHIDLTLCGHAHGGLIRLPGTDGLIGPHREFFPSYTAGLYDLPYGQLVASRGLGNQFPAFRLFNRPDVPVVVLE